MRRRRRRSGRERDDDKGLVKAGALLDCFCVCVVASLSSIFSPLDFIYQKQIKVVSNSASPRGGNSMTIE